jgi:hypothetical protein
MCNWLRNCIFYLRSFASNSTRIQIQNDSFRVKIRIRQKVSDTTGSGSYSGSGSTTLRKWQEKHRCNIDTKPCHGILYGPSVKKKRRFSTPDPSWNTCNWPAVKDRTIQCCGSASRWCRSGFDLITLMQILMRIQILIFIWCGSRSRS